MKIAQIIALMCTWSIFQADITAKEIVKIVKVEMTVPASVNTEKVTASIPALKYNKKLVTTWTVDDSYSIYNQIFSVVNKKWVDDELMSYWNPDDTRTFFYHLNGERTNGYVPEKTLEYTDGCGIAHRFAASVASWPWKLSGYDQDVSKYNMWVSCKEMRMMQDFGYTFCYHDLAPSFSPKSQAEFDQTLAAAADSFETKTGRTPKIMIEPNGDHSYVTYSLNNDIIETSIAQTIDRYVYPFKEKESLEKGSGCIIRYFDTKPDDLLAKLSYDLLLPANERKWHLNGSHRQSVKTVSYFFQKLDSLYGSGGEDCVWVPSVDEYVEYSYMRNHTTIDKSVSGNKITFTLRVPVKDRFWFQSLSLLVSGISDTTHMKVSASDNAYGLSYGISDEKLLVNLDFNDYLPEHAEKYTAIFEQEKTIEAYEDANYFISMLKKELQAPFLNRINSLLSPPTASGFSINKGDLQTENRTVSISFNASKSAVYYRLSESADFEDASWKALESQTPFMLSPDLGKKTVYLQLKNALYTSDIFSASIDLKKSYFKLVVGFSGRANNNKETVNGEVLNNVVLGMKDEYTAIQLYDKDGEKSALLARNTSEIGQAMKKYGITACMSKLLGSRDLKSSENTGTYPDRFYSRVYFFGSNTVCTPETQRLVAGFIKLPNGIYNVRILASQNKTTNEDEYTSYRYQVNHSDIYIPDSDYFYNNHNHFIEFKNVKVEDSTLLICSWREAKTAGKGYYAPMNLVEIKESVEPDVSTPQITKSICRIWAKSGRLIVENEDMQSFTIYGIDGTIIKQIIPESTKTEVNLSPGTYIINEEKVIIYK